MKFFVKGGEYTGTDFKTIVPGTEESYGPFSDYGQAYKVWEGRARAQMDICCHKLSIIKEA